MDIINYEEYMASGMIQPQCYFCRQDITEDFTVIFVDLEDMCIHIQCV